MEYFGDRESGARPQIIEKISQNVWGGIQAEIQARIDDGSFGNSFPELCPDGQSVVGTNETNFRRAATAEVPEFDFSFWESGDHFPAGATTVLELVQFCWKNVRKPIQVGAYHSFFEHHHLRYDKESGQESFRDQINTIFQRNAIAFELSSNGEIIRLAPPVLHERLELFEVNTGDDALNLLLSKAKRKFLQPDFSLRKESLDALWAAWERLKTVDNKDKKLGAQQLLDTAACANTGKFRTAIENEAKALTDLGNSLSIRHSETTQEALGAESHVDYLFHRLFSLIWLILTERSKS